MLRDAVRSQIKGGGELRVGAGVDELRLAVLAQHVQADKAVRVDSPAVVRLQMCPTQVLRNLKQMRLKRVKSMRVPLTASRQWKWQLLEI